MNERTKVSALIAAVVLTASGAFAARPLIIDDADPLGFKDFKIEGGDWYEKDSGYPFSHPKMTFLQNFHAPTAPLPGRNSPKNMRLN